MVEWFSKSSCADVVFRQKQILSNYFSLSLEFSQQINVVFTIYRKGFFESENSNSPLPTWNRFLLSCQIFDTWYTKPFTMHVRCLKLCHFQIWLDIFTILQNKCMQEFHLWNVKDQTFHILRPILVQMYTI